MVGVPSPSRVRWVAPHTGARLRAARAREGRPGGARLRLRRSAALRTGARPHVRCGSPCGRSSQERKLARLRFLSFAALAAYIGTVYGANWALRKFGVVSIGFGLTAPAGVFFAGLALGLRDFVQESLGRVAVVAAILGGARSLWLGANGRSRADTSRSRSPRDRVPAQRACGLLRVRRFATGRSPVASSRRTSSERSSTPRFSYGLRSARSSSSPGSSSARP